MRKGQYVVYQIYPTEARFGYFINNSTLAPNTIIICIIGDGITFAEEHLVRVAKREDFAKFNYAIPYYMNFSFKQILKLFRAIRDMEKACLASSGHQKITIAAMLNDMGGLRSYFMWLKRQCQVTGMFYDFDKLIAK